MVLNYLTHGCLNLILTPLVLALLPLMLPLLIIYRLILSIYGRFFNENMSGKVILITGASSGIGEHMAYEYAKKRANLVIVDKRKKQLFEVARKARGLGSPDVVMICADVSSIDDCKRFIDDTINHFGRLDHLLNNAGIGSVCKLEDAIDVANFKSLMDVNFWGSIYPTFFAIPHLKRSKGKIYVASSSAALMNPPTGTFYSASKSAVLGFFESLRLELAPSVTITIGTLGFIESGMTKGNLLSKDGQMSTNPQLIQPILRLFPIMRVGSAAKAIVEGICRGERYVTEPSWYRVLHLLKFLCPEVAEWWLNIMYMKKLDIMNGEAPTSRTSVLPTETEANKFS